MNGLRGFALKHWVGRAVCPHTAGCACRRVVSPELYRVDRHMGESLHERRRRGEDIAPYPEDGLRNQLVALRDRRGLAHGVFETLRRWLGLSGARDGSCRLRCSERG
jgi:hypothetical protein